MQVFVDQNFSRETSSGVDLVLDVKQDKILILSVPFQLALLKSVHPTIASTGSRHNVEWPNYAADKQEIEEQGNFYQVRILRKFS